VDPIILNNRLDECLIIISDFDYNVYTKEDGNNLLQYLYDSLRVNINLSELSGTTAYPGWAKGIVKRVDDVEDIGKFNEGDILVSTSTTPKIIPAMKRAGAIITDTGGITCHAAIVSRELKVPCVIGTRIATKVLRDGDEVEVDANNGVIKKV